MQNIGKFLSWDLPCIVFNSQKITIMLNKKTNEELQSRREFFKQAAKAALPVVGAVILSQLPVVASATPTGCSSDGCSNTCATSCQKDCIGSCHYGCKRTCSGTCSGSSK